MKTTKIGPFLGVNNRLPDFELQPEPSKSPSRYVRSALNVDLDNAGNFCRRESELLVQAMTAPHSLHLTSETEGYLVRASAIYAVVVAPAYSETFVKLLSSDAPVSWVAEGDSIYYANGTDSGRITAGVFYPLGLPTPDEPTLTATSGQLDAGNYQVAISFINNITKEESGTSSSGSVSVAALGGVTVTLPTPPSGATHTNVYLSSVNGSIPMLVGTYVTGTPSATFISAANVGREAPQRFESPLPSGRLFMSKGRLCSFDDTGMLYIGLPYRYGYYDMVAGWMQFNAPVSFAIENQNGTYIAADKTYWIPGDLGDVKDTISEPFPFGAVLGTEWRHPATTDIGWFSENGFIVANTQGEAVPVTFDYLDITNLPDEGVSNIRWTDGYVRVYSCGYCMNLENNHPTQYTGYDFTSFAGDFGTKIDGVYALTDSAAKVSAKVGLGKQDFSTEELKHLPNVYLGCSSPEPLEMQVQWPDPRTGEIQDYTYPARNADTSVRMQRVDVGKGARSSWFDLTVYNQSGSDFTLASVSFTPLASGRRI